MKKFILIVAMILAFVAIGCGNDNGNENGNGDKPGEIREITAIELVKDMGIGINIGNTLDSLTWPGGGTGETSWGNPKISIGYIKALKDYGYKSIRLPVSWADWIGPAPDYEIAESWMNRVEEVVDWIIAEDMYVIVNLHHDGGEGNPKCWIADVQLSSALLMDEHKSKFVAGKEEDITDKFTKVWRQIAHRFRDKSDFLILESMNEVGFDFVFNRWNNSSGHTPNKNEAFRLMNKLNQTFVDTVRATGSNNTLRCLLIAGYWTDIGDSSWPEFKMPDDSVSDALILSIHYYSPSVFCISDNPSNGWGYQATWGSPKDRDDLKADFDKLKTNFIDKGVPAIAGEYGATRKKADAERLKWTKAVLDISAEYGVCPVLWDTGWVVSGDRGGGEIERNSPFRMRQSLKDVWDYLQQK
jgi:endoglucanase